MMKRGIAALFLTIVVLTSACAAAKKEARPWQPGESIICPHCGRSFPVPEKLSK
jgi:hypothetical protein